MLPATFYLDLFVIGCSAATVGLIFWSTRLQRKANEAQRAANEAQMRINLTHHARLANLERRVLADEIPAEVRPN